MGERLFEVHDELLGQICCLKSNPACRAIARVLVGVPTMSQAIEAESHQLASSRSIKTLATLSPLAYYRWELPEYSMPV